MTYRPWQDSEVEYLRNSASESFLKDLAAHLDRPPKMVRYKLDQLGLKARDARKGNSGVPATIWTAQRLAYLRENASTSSAASIGQMLGVSAAQVRQALNHYKIQGRGRERAHPPEEIEKRVAPLRDVPKVPRDAPRECSSCHEVKPVHQYPSEKSLQSTMCEECRKEARKQRWEEASPEEKRKEYLRYRTRKHGISAERYVELLELQGYACAVCCKPFPAEGEGRSPQIDHDHDHCAGAYGCSECVRGLVCGRCNVAVGWAETFNASPEYLEAIGRYLARTR